MIARAGPWSWSAFEGFPHFLVTLRSPDPGIGILCRFVVCAGYVKWRAVVEDDPVAKFRLERGIGFLIDGVQVLAFAGTRLHLAVELADKGTRARETIGNFLGRLQGGTTTGNQFFGLQRSDCIEGCRPILEVRIAGVRRCTVLDQVTGQERLFLRKPDDRVAFRVTATKLQDPDAIVAT